MTAWLVLPDGAQLPVGPAGLLLGRRGDCDLITPDRTASRCHALVQLRGDHLEVHPLGRAATEVNDGEIEAVTPLRDGDRLRVPGLEVRARVSAPQQGASWVLAGPARYGVRRLPFRVGSSADSDLVLAAWGEATLELRSDEAGCLHGRAGGVRHNGASASGAIELAPGDVVGAGGVTLRIERATAGSDWTTARPAGAPLPTGVALEFTPRGGLLTVTLASGAVRIALTELRCDLVATLLQPPSGAAGDWVDDEALTTRIWGRGAGKRTADVRVLLHRVRRTLSDAGIDGMRVLERAPGGGATRFALGEGAGVEVQ